ncbi:MAG TPA: PQQ-dependent sugar dehydrogenase [Solirubrobacteraceae bacterium]|jgi:glucose/arabinose dehydrogenase/PKD repeat protein
MTSDSIRRPSARALGIAAVLAVTIITAMVAAPRASALPAGFQNSRFALVTGYPTSISFLPDGRALVSSLFGQVYVVDANGTFNSTPLLTVPVCTDREQGMQSVAVSPTFASDHYIYVYYTSPRNGTCGTTLADGAINRFVRYQLDPVTTTVDPSTATPLLDNLPAHHGFHNGGAVDFAKDGNVLVTVGDGGCHYITGDCGLGNPVAQQLNSLQGKVLKITPSGGIPSTNPYTGAGTAPCAQTGYVAAGTKCQEIYANGLRNPFRIAVDEGPQDRFFIDDVGGEYWEEVNAGAKGANYGWPTREGACNASSYTDCPPPPAALTDPIYAYPHTSGCKSVTGGAFVPAGLWPSSYDGAYLYGDFVCGSVFLKAAPAETGAVSEFETGIWNNTDMTFGPVQGGGRALYVVKPTTPEIRKITYIAAGNRAPVASATATPTQGAAPLTVQFNGTGSTDADGNALTYAWDFGDGATATGSTASHTYAANGTYTAKLTVTDTLGAKDTTTVKIEVGNKPVPVIDAPTTSGRFVVGQHYTLTGHATDAEDGQLADAKLTWEVRLHHNEHFHPYVQPVAGNNVDFTAPAPEDFIAATNSNLEVRLTATDSDGLSTSVVQDFDPKKVTLTFETAPSGLKLKVGELNVTGPQNVVSWQGFSFAVDAPLQLRAGRVYGFGSWSDGGARQHTITTPASDTTYRATFAQRRTASDTADFNGDGYADLAVGAPGEDLDGANDAGVVNVKYGAANGLVVNGPDRQISQSAASGLAEDGDRFGASLATGDFNNDGYSDLAVGAPGEDLDASVDAGIINVMYGSSAGLNTGGSPRQFSQSQDAGLAETNDRFGTALAGGDFDGDGYDDLVASAPDEDFNGAAAAGVINVQYGSSTGLTGNTRAQQWTQNSAAGAVAAGDRYGAALAAGDFDADGRADLAAGTPGEDFKGTDSGLLNVTYGTATGLAGNTRARQISQSQMAGLSEQGDHFAASLTTGDFDGDGRSDLAVGAPDEDFNSNRAAGVVNTVYGSATGLGTTVQQFTQSQSAGLAEVDDRFGASLAAGDFDGDGRGDLAIGAPDEALGAGPSSGVVNVQYGSAAGLTGTRVQQWLQNAAAGLTEGGDRFGASLAGADFDTDGRTDLAMGAPGQDLDGSVDAGIINLMYGTSSGLAGNTRAAQFSQSQTSGLTEAGDAFGGAMGTTTWVAPASSATATTLSAPLTGAASA